MMGLHICKTLMVIMKDVEGSLDDVRDDLEGMRAKTEGAVVTSSTRAPQSQLQTHNSKTT